MHDIGGAWGTYDYFGPPPWGMDDNFCSQDALHKMKMHFEETLNQIQ